MNKLILAFSAIFTLFSCALAANAPAYQVKINNLQNERMVYQAEFPLTVTADIQPKLKDEKAVLTVYTGLKPEKGQESAQLTGKKEKEGASISFAISQLNPGANTVKVQILSTTGAIVGESDPVVVYLFKRRQLLKSGS